MCNKLWGIMEKLKKASKTFQVKIPESLVREKNPSHLPGHKTIGGAPASTPPRSPSD